MSRPRLLDLFCCSGGAGMGYHRMGFEVVGVDIARHHYPAGEFVQFDAIEMLTNHPEYLQTFDAIHASPPCQASSALTKGTNRETKAQNHTDLIGPVRELLKATGLPWVIENVQGSALRRDLTLCGEMFGLGVIRHRYFEVDGFDVTAPAHKPHRGRVQGWRHGEYFDGPYFAVYGDGGGKGTVQEWQQAMGIDWTSDRLELAEAIPPAYTEWIGAQLIEQVRAKAA